MALLYIRARARTNERRKTLHYLHHCCSDSSGDTIVIVKKVKYTELWCKVILNKR